MRTGFGLCPCFLSRWRRAAGVLSAVFLLSACSGVGSGSGQRTSPAAESTSGVPPETVICSDFERIFGSVTGGSERSDARSNDGGQDAEGLYLKLSEPDWPSALTERWTDTGNGRRFKGTCAPVTFDLTLDASGEWIRNIQVTYAFDERRPISEQAGYRSDAAAFEAECGAVSDALLMLREHLIGKEADHLGARQSDAAPAPGALSMQPSFQMHRLLLGRSAHCRNVRYTFDGDAAQRKLVLDFTAVPHCVLDTAIERIPAFAAARPDIGVCLKNDRTVSSIGVMAGVWDICRERALSLSVSVCPDESDLMAAVKAHVDRGARALVIEDLTNMNLAALLDAAGGVPIVCLEGRPQGADGVQIGVVTAAGADQAAQAIAADIRKRVPGDRLNVVLPFLPDGNRIDDIDRERYNALQRALTDAYQSVGWQDIAPPAQDQSLPLERLRAYRISGAPADAYIGYGLTVLGEWPLMQSTLGLSGAAGQPLCYGYNANLTQLMAVQAGVLAGMIYEDWPNVGRRAVDTALSMAAQQPADPVQLVPGVLVTPDNVLDFLDPASEQYGRAAARLPAADASPDRTAPLPAASQKSDTAAATGDVVPFDDGSAAAADDPVELRLVYESEILSSVDTADLNRALAEKGYPYRLSIENRTPELRSGYIHHYFPDSAADGTAPDLIILSSGATAFQMPLDHFVADGLVADLTDILNAAPNRPLYERYPERLWTALQVNGRQYALPGEPSWRYGNAACWVNRQLADRYGIDISGWSTDIWTHREDLLKVWKGERDNPRFSLMFAPRLHIPAAPALTPAAGSWVPVVFDEAAGRFKCLYEDETYVKSFRFAQSLVDADQLTYINGADTFFIAYQQPADHAADYEPIEPGVCKLYQPFNSMICVPAASQHQAAAVDLIRILYTDEAIHAAFQSAIQAKGLALVQPFLSDAERAAAFEYYASFESSALLGQPISTAECADEMAAVVEIMLDVRRRPALGTKETAINPETDLALLKAAGIDTVIDCLNRQLDELEIGP